MLRNWMISTRLGISLLMLCLALVVTGGIGLFGTMINHRVTQEIVADEAAVVVIGKINIKVFDSRLHIAQALLQSDPDALRKEGKVIADNNQDTLKDLAALRELVREGDKSQVVAAFVQAVSDFLEHYLRPVEQALLAADIQQVNALVATQANRHYSPIKQTRTDLMKVIEQSTQAEQQKADETYRLALYAILGTVGAGLVMAVLFGGAIVRTISRDTRDLLQGMQQIRNDADLTRRLPVRGQDELAQVADATNTLLAMFQEFTRSVRAQSEQNILATSSLLTRAGSVSASAQEQSQSAGRASDQLVAIVDSIHAISRRVAETQALTVSSAELGHQGNAIVSGTATEMRQVADQVRVAAADIKNLDKQSQEIDTIVSAISEIANQTNLLALNAAIESARAGEYGRGFAVVADEVRKLAENTHHLTEEIQRTISSIRQETATAAACMESGQVMAERGVATAEQASRMIDRIQQALDAISGSVSDIAQTLHHQESAADVVVEQIGQIARLSQSNALDAESSRQLAGQSEEGSRELARATSAFRV